MKKLERLFFFLCLLSLFCLFHFLNAGEGKGDLATLSLSSFERLFQSDTAREIFDLEDSEATEVFGDMREEVFL